MAPARENPQQRVPLLMRGAKRLDSFPHRSVLGARSGAGSLDLGAETAVGSHRLRTGEACALAVRCAERAPCGLGEPASLCSNSASLTTLSVAMMDRPLRLTLTPALAANPSERQTWQSALTQTTGRHR